MADGGIGDIAGLAAGANPYSGIAEAAAGAVKGITESITASQQAQRAQKLRDQANQVQTQTIRPEYLTAEHNAQAASLYGLPHLQAYQDKIGQNIANSVRAIKESSPNGEATLAAINSTFGNGMNAYNDLDGKDAQAQEAKAATANQTIWNVGDKQRQLEDIRDKQKLQLQQQAAALENASTANKQTGINDATGGVEQGASQIFRKGSGYDSQPQGSTYTLPYQQGTQLPSGAGMSAYGLAL